MTSIESYLNDGANHQARAVLMYLQRGACVEDSWNTDKGRYDAQPTVSRWENCREQGYVICMNNPQREQINIAFFEHRNSDEICAVMWVQNTINAPTIETAKFGGVYTDKYDVSFSVSHGECYAMATKIQANLTAHWNKTA